MHISKKIALLVLLSSILISSTSYYFLNGKKNTSLPTSIQPAILTSTSTIAIATTTLFKYGDYADVSYLTVTTKPQQQIGEKITKTLRSVAIESCFLDPENAEDIESLRDMIRENNTKNIPESVIKKATHKELASMVDYYSMFSEKVIYQDTHILSIDLYSEVYCGGAHPNSGRYGLAFDLTTGEIFPQSEFFTATTTEGSPLEKTVRNYLITQKAIENGCDLPEGGVLDYADFSLVREGLSINYLGYSHAEAPCTPFDFVLPYTILMPYISEKLKLVAAQK